MRNTKQRSKITDILKTSERALSAEEIFTAAKDSLPHLALTTVYRNLEALLANNIISKTIGADAVARYEYIKGKNIHNHFLVCVECNKYMPIETCPIKAIEKDISDNTGFEITGHSLEIYGYCKECLKNHKDNV